RLSAVDRLGVLNAFAERLAEERLIPHGEALYLKLCEREQLGSTGIGSGIAIPHCKLPGLAHGVVALGIVPEGVDFGAIDGNPVKLFFLVLSPPESPAEHLQILAAISRWIKADGHAEAILELPDAGAIYRFLQQEGG
ncbi:MAG TPA: PTS sugar transporter subunit IIA, partial [Thermoanaerobaculia bacterium]